MDPDRKFWNEQQKALRKALRGEQPFEQAINLLLRQHAMVHAGLLLMPPTRHNFIHINEALRIKKRCLKVQGA